MGIMKRHLSHRENQKNQKPKNKNERKFIRNEDKNKMEIMKNTHDKNCKNHKNRKNQRPKNKNGRKFRNENKMKTKVEIMKNTYCKSQKEGKKKII